MVRLIAPSNSRRRKVGAVVNVADSSVENLVRRGFTKPEPKTTAKKAAAKKSSNK